MKKSKFLIVPIFLLLIVSLISFSLAQEPTAPISDKEVQAIQQATEQIPINPETGGFDETKFGIWQSKAEQRIDSINEWLTNNVYWMKWAFGMPPEISWLFALNLYLILFFLVYLVFRIKDWLTIVQEENVAQMIGAIIFLTLLISKLILKLAALILDALNYIWIKIIPYVFASAILAAVAVILIAILLAVFFPAALEGIIKWLAQKKLKQEAKGKTAKTEKAEQAMKKLEAFEKGREEIEKSNRD